MVKSKILNSHESSNFVENFFLQHLESYKLRKKGIYTGYWWIEYEKESIIISFDGDIGYSFSIYVSDTKYSLWQYDRSVNNCVISTEENILYQLQVLKKFLDEIGY